MKSAHTVNYARIGSGSNENAESAAERKRGIENGEHSTYTDTRAAAGETNCGSSSV